MLFADNVAEKADQAAPKDASPLSGLAGMLPMFLIIGILFYLMLIRPQKTEQKKRLALLNNLKKNDRVVTIGGIYGVVMNVRREADEVVIKVDETNDTKIRVLISAVARVVVDEPAEDSKGK
jgi:preprotein translocase subunit YajC